MATNASRQLTFEQALSRAAALCSASEHCITDITDKLARWGMSSAQTDEIIDRLLAEKYIDEERYAMAYARDKMRFSQWGKAKIRMMLRMQHISDRDIHNALDELDPEEYSLTVQKVIEAKIRSVGTPTDYNSRARIIRFAMQRGFEMDEITKFIPDY